MTVTIHPDRAQRDVGIRFRNCFASGSGRGVLSIALAGLMLVVSAYAFPVTGNEAVSVGYSEAQVELRDLLEGKAFSGPTGTVGMDADHQETVLFSEGSFRSLACEQWGFEPESLRTDQVDGAVHFEAVQRSADYGTMTWRGTIRGGKLEAHYVWEKERLFWTTRREYWFSGVIEEANDDRDHAI